MSVLFYNEIASPFIQTKALLHFGKLLELSKSNIITPITCEIDLTDGFCNNKCSHCFFSTNNKNEPILMPKVHAIALISELSKLGVRGIEFSGGGEPLTHPECEEIIQSGLDNNLDIGLVSNGLLLDRIIGISGKLTFIRVSLDAANSQTYKMIHGVDSFNRVINNIMEIVDKHGGNNIGIGYLLLPNNIEDIIPATELAKKIGVRFIQFRPASLPFDVEKKVWEEAFANVKKATQLATDSFQVFNAGIKWIHVIHHRHYTQCKTSSLVGVIKANGDIPLCVLNRNEESKIIGNFIKEKGFKNVWFSKKHTDLINFIDINMCRRPCKHDSYNIVYEAVINDYIHCNFL